MHWNDIKKMLRVADDKLNNNMECIETWNFVRQTQQKDGGIIT